ncbi:CocE/NonD family hydrolase [Kutzneria sp. CA-103260]|uniref:CocE/NonD family hydrolase n=1 Tax=Kutzneria sp. CA-103260 TaxID=2802641 RepID=UPI001BADFB2B|nr:CocE/NonD family hydrolase [Kutzneria sp. CA-103260]QUQ68854.1 peptidase S15 [Kutzneria sp. CA-103260]
MSSPISAEMIEAFVKAGSMAAGGPTATIAEQDLFFAYDRPATHGVHIETIQVPTRDGSYLVCDLYRPAGPDGEPADGRFPGIVYDFNAYNARQIFGGGARHFVERGYVAAVASVRGSGGTPGHVVPFGRQEQEDSYDLVEWLAVQPFSTGKVGQMGVSYGGHNTLLCAVNQPPHLVAVIAVQAISDWYENTIYRGGIYNARIRDWQQTTAPDTLDIYPQHPLYDEFWRERSVKARWDKLTVPVLDVGGWLDPYRDAMVQNFVAREANTWMVAGPWEHGMVPGQREDIASACYLAWWDHWLADLPTPLPQAKVTSYEMPEHGWRQYSTWPPAESSALSWFPAVGGLLGADPGAASIAQFEAGKENVQFGTPRLDHDVVVVGGIEMTVRAAFTGEDGNIAVVLDDVDQDGVVTRVSNGWLKASHREGHEQRVPVVAGTFYSLTIPMWPTHHRVAAGHTLRLTISSEDYPQIESEDLPGTVSVELGTSATQLGFRAVS